MIGCSIMVTVIDSRVISDVVLRYYWWYVSRPIDTTTTSNGVILHLSNVTQPNTLLVVYKPIHYGNNSASRCVYVCEEMGSDVLMVVKIHEARI